MDELSRYVFNYYPNLMTVREKSAYKHLIGLKKADFAESEKLKNFTEKFWCSADPEVLELLEGGEDLFFENVTKRILHQHQKEIFLNYCPKCGALARTPSAKQCSKCFYSWHLAAKES